MQDPHLETHTAMHDMLELPGAPAEAKTTSTLGQQTGALRPL